MPSLEMLRHGTDTRRPAPIMLRAGPLTLLFEPDLVFLRQIRLGDREVLRGVYYAVRDQNWHTVAPRVTDLQVEARADSFALRVEVECRCEQIDFAWHGRISGSDSGKLTFSVEGLARSTFLRNRIGLCVLHPDDECAGSPCTLKNVEGERLQTAFPQWISPHQPLRNIRALTHEVLPGVNAEVRFAGDIFETEDQRNWTDASFKTYSTPLDRPFPVEVAAGTLLAQSVTLTLAPVLPRSNPVSGTAPAEVAIQVEDTTVPLPAVGLGWAAGEEPPSEAEVARLRAARMHHLRVDLDSASGIGPLRDAAALAARIGASLEVALLISDESTQLLNALLTERLPDEIAAAWFVLPAPGQEHSGAVVAEAVARLRERFPASPIGVGTNAYFAQLNRTRPAADGADLVVYSVNPQVHAFDDSSLIENLRAQAATVESAEHLYPGKAIAVSPVTLRPRFNPDATAPEAEPLPGEMPSTVDSRQLSLFGAGWTLGSLKYLAEAGASRVTFYETTGWRGLMEREDGPARPKRFPSLPGAVFPLYHLLADAGEFTGGAVLRSSSSDPLGVISLALRTPKKAAVLVANLTGEDTVARVTLPEAVGAVTIRSLDETTVLKAMTAPELFRADSGNITPVNGRTVSLELKPYAVVRLTLTAAGEGH